MAQSFRETAESVREALRHCPHERRAMAFEVSALFGGMVLAIPVVGSALKALGRGFAVAIQSFAPAINFDLGDGGPPPRRTFEAILVRVGVLTFVLCYIGCGYFAYQSERLFPAVRATAKSASVSFLGDWWNFILYLIVVPLYVSCAIFLVYVTAISWKRINGMYAERVAAPSFWSESTRVLGFFAVSFAIAGLFTANYIADLADPVRTPGLYWFFHQTPAGERTLNQAGFYYVFLNAVLLFITAMAAFCFIALSIEVLRFGKFIPEFVASIRAQSEGAPNAHEATLADAEKGIQETLDEYAYAYIVAKVLVATYAVNIVIWQISPAGSANNVDAAIVALAIIGLIFLVAPRLYLNSKWHRARLAMLKAAGKGDDPSIGEELRPRRFRRSETWLDAVFLFLLFRAASKQAEGWGWAQEIINAIGAFFG